MPRNTSLVRRVWIASLLVLASGSAFAGDAGHWRRLELPTRRWFHAAAYDASAQRLVIYGGDAPGGGRTDVWLLDVAPAWHWTHVEPVTAGPPATYGMAYAYDSVRRRLLVFGGHDGVQYTGDVWALSLSGAPAWTHLTAAGGPSARNFAAMIYDPLGDRLIVHGGRNASGPLGDVWALTLSGTPAWSALSPGGGPTARYAEAAAYDPLRHRLVVFGGGTSGGPVNELWALALGGSPAWSLLGGTGTAPAPNRYKSMVYDPANDRMVIFAGLGAGYLNEVHAYAFAGGGTWTDLAPAGDLPPGRVGQSATYDPVHGAMIVFGGGDDDTFQYYDDLWLLSLTGTPAWSQPVGHGAPPRRFDHSAIYDPVRQRMVVFGGESELGAENSVHVLPLDGEPSWEVLATAGNPPAPRWGHTAIYDAAHDRMIVFGGQNGVSWFDDAWELTLGGTPTWSLLATGRTVPAARGEHAAVYDPVQQRMLVTGGRDPFSYFDDTWALSLDALPVWSLVAAGTPQCFTPFAFHTLVRDPLGDRYFVQLGDSYGTPFCPTLWTLDAGVQPYWAEFAVSGPALRYDHSAIWEPTWERMVVMGGGHVSTGPGDPARQFADVWELVPGAPEWNELVPAAYLPSQPRPDSLVGHTAILDVPRHRMIVFGGSSGLGLPEYRTETWALEWTPGTTAIGPGGPGRGGELRLRVGPNPAPRGVAIDFTLPVAARVDAAVFDVAGRLVRTLGDGRTSAAGPQSLRWDGRGAGGERAAAGLYLVRVRAGEHAETRRVMLLH